MKRTLITELKPGDILDGNIVVLHVEPQNDGGYTLHTASLGPLPVGHPRTHRKYKRSNCSLLVVRSSAHSELAEAALQTVVGTTLKLDVAHPDLTAHPLTAMRNLGISWDRHVAGDTWYFFGCTHALPWLPHYLSVLK